MTIQTKVWIAGAILHQEGKAMFSGPELIEAIMRLPGDPPQRTTLYSMLSHHLSAEKRPTSIRVRYLTALGKEGRHSRLRLFRQGDSFHPERANGRITPDATETPLEYRGLLDWYWKTMASEERKNNKAGVDPFSELKGLGKEVWFSLGGARFIDELRSNWFEEVSSQTSTPVPERVVEFLREHRGRFYCDDCLAKELEISEQGDIQPVTTTLGLCPSEFERRRGACPSCRSAQPKLIIRAPKRAA